MANSLDAIQNRLRWINRGILLLAALVLVGLLVFALRSSPAGRASVATMKTSIVSQSEAKAPRVLISVSKPATSAPASEPNTSIPAAAIPGTEYAAPVSRPSQQAFTSARLAAHTLANAASTPLKAAVVHHADSTARVESATHPSIGYSASPERKVKTDRQRLRHREARHIVPHNLVREGVWGNVKQRVALKSATCFRPGWYVQVGAFSKLWRFERLQMRLQRDVFATCKAPQTPKDLSPLLVGPYATRDSAKRAQLRIKMLLGTDNYLLRLLSRY